jgi:hypothetical protein
MGYTDSKEYQERFAKMCKALYDLGDDPQLRGEHHGDFVFLMLDAAAEIAVRKMHPDHIHNAFKDALEHFITCLSGYMKRAVDARQAPGTKRLQ